MNENQNAEQSQEAQAAGSELKGSVRPFQAIGFGPNVWDLQTCPYCSATFGLVGIARVEYTEHVLRCASKLNA